MAGIKAPGGGNYPTYTLETPDDLSACNQALANELQDTQTQEVMRICIENLQMMTLYLAESNLLADRATDPTIQPEMPKRLSGEYAKLADAMGNMRTYTDTSDDEEHRFQWEDYTNIAESAEHIITRVDMPLEAKQRIARALYLFEKIARINTQQGPKEGLDDATRLQRADENYRIYRDIMVRGLLVGDELDGSETKPQIDAAIAELADADQQNLAVQNGTRALELLLNLHGCNGDLERMDAIFSDLAGSGLEGIRVVHNGIVGLHQLGTLERHNLLYGTLNWVGISMMERMKTENPDTFLEEYTTTAAGTIEYK